MRPHFDGALWGHGMKFETPIVLFILGLAAAISVTSANAQDFAALHKQSLEFSEQGEYTKAFEAASQAFEIAEKTEGVNNPAKATLANYAARFASDALKWEEAVQHYRFEIHYLELEFDQHASETMYALISIVRIQVGTFQKTELKGTLSEMRSVSSIHFTKPGKLRCDYYLAAGLANEALGDYSEAIDFFEQAISDGQALNDNICLGDAQFRKAKVLFTKKQSSRAANEITEAIESYSHSLPPHDKRLLDAYTFLTKVYITSGKEKKAENAIQYILLYQGEVDRENLQPIYRTPPRYPVRALSRGISGWVLLEFTIGTDGKVRNARVIDSDPKKIFDKVGIEAVEQWRYVPIVENGVVIEITSQTNLSFGFQR